MRRASNRILEHQPRQSESRGLSAHVSDQLPQAFGVWLTQREAAIYTRRKSVKSFYQWRKSHGVVVHHGLIARADLDRAIRATRQTLDRRGAAAASQRNLRKVG